MVYHFWVQISTFLNSFLSILGPYNITWAWYRGLTRTVHYWTVDVIVYYKPPFLSTDSSTETIENLESNRCQNKSLFKLLRAPVLVKLSALKGVVSYDWIQLHLSLNMLRWNEMQKIWELLSIISPVCDLKPSSHVSLCGRTCLNCVTTCKKLG